MSRKLYERVTGFADRLAVFVPAPPRTKNERAVYDAWKAALQPRARRMQRRVEWLADARHWEFDEDREPVRLRATAWSRAVREIAALFTELSGALAQHENVRIIWRPKTRFGIIRGASRPIPTAKTKAKERAAEKKALDGARRAQMKAARKVLDTLLAELEKVRKALRETIRETQHVTAALKMSEEARLAARVVELAEDSSERERAEDLLLDLAQGRLNAQRFRDPKSSGYGALVRRQWLQPRARLVRLLEGP